MMIFEVLVLVTIVIGFAVVIYVLRRGEKETIMTDMAGKHHAIEQLVNTIQSELQSRQTELRSLEQDRMKKFGELTSALEQQRLLSDSLRVSTQQLAEVLANNQQRGGWGERIIEDLLTANGLIEGIHYAKQRTLPQTSLRPDIVLLLPNERVVPVDVKFPFAQISQLASTKDAAERQRLMKEFGSLFKAKIAKVGEYIRPEAKTLDYAILFVPNEMVFSFINQHFSEIIDTAISQRVLIVSPFTFLIVARTVIESYRNFMIEDKLKDILQYIGEFVGEWQQFQGEFSKFGRSLETLSVGYEKLQTTRVKQMERKIKKIQTSQHGAAALPIVPNSSELPESL